MMHRSFPQQACDRSFHPFKGILSALHALGSTRIGSQDAAIKYAAGVDYFEWICRNEQFKLPRQINMELGVALEQRVPAVAAPRKRARSRSTRSDGRHIAGQST